MQKKIILMLFFVTIIPVVFADIIDFALEEKLQQNPTELIPVIVVMKSSS